MILQALKTPIGEEQVWKGRTMDQGLRKSLTVIRNEEVLTAEHNTVSILRVLRAYFLIFLYDNMSKALWHQMPNSSQLSSQYILMVLHLLSWAGTTKAWLCAAAKHRGLLLLYKSAMSWSLMPHSMGFQDSVRFPLPHLAANLWWPCSISKARDARRWLAIGLHPHSSLRHPWCLAWPIQ